MQMIKNVIFDIGNVLMGFDWKTYASSLFNEETVEALQNALWKSGHWKQLDLAILSEEEILELFYEGAPDHKTEIREAFYRVGECVSRIDWAIPMIESIRERGYKVYFLSNMSEHVINSNPSAFDFVGHMDGGIFSCHVHKIKPDAAFYELLMEKYGLVPEECLFIDDHSDNIAAGRKLGMKGIIFKNLEQLKADLDKALTKDSTHDKITVLCYGDSNTYGHDPWTGGRYPYEKRWTTILGRKLGDRFEVIPEGLNGRTTAYDRPGAAWKNGINSFIATLGTHKPVDYVVIMLGTNDCNAGLGLTSQQIAGGMETLVKIVEEKSPELQGYIPEIIVTAPAPIGDNYENSPFAYELIPESVRTSRDIGPLYREIAARHMCRFADAAGRVEVSDFDSLHLSERGHEQMAELIYETIMDRNYDADALTGKSVKP